MESQLSPVQVQETKRAFFGGVSAMLSLMQNELPGLPDMAAVHQLENLVKQNQRFWDNEVVKRDYN